MGGGGDELSVGERIAFYRRRRGLTQVVLSGLVNRSEDWLSKVERGEREVRRLDVLSELAEALRVPLGDLLGQPRLMAKARRNHGVTAIQNALLAPQRLSRVLFAEMEGGWQPNTTHTASRVEGAWEQFQSGRIGQTIGSLPDLIQTARALEGCESTGRARWAVSARVHHLAVTTLSKVGESGLAWIAAERAMDAADNADDPLVLASAARAGTHALLSVGKYDDALELGQVAREWLSRRLRGGHREALSLVGMLDLRMAIAAARRQDRSTASELLNRAESAAHRLGQDANLWHTAFGPTNVRLHRAAAAMDLGDISYVIENGPLIDASAVPMERQVSHHINLARANSLVARDEEAMNIFLSTEKMAPQLVRSNRDVRETVRELYRRASVGSGRGRTSALVGFAERCRAV